MDKEKVEKLTNRILDTQDQNFCWNVLQPGDKYYPQYNYYSPIYSSTLWTLILLADIKTEIRDDRVFKPLDKLTENLYDWENSIYTIGKSHFPIPCLNGNMIYLHCYFEHGDFKIVNSIVDFFNQYQRFDDGDYNTPKEYPYISNKSCYGKHTCYWGITKLLKGLSFIPKDKRSKNAKELIKKCIDFILLHEVCYSSQNRGKILHTNIKKLTFPNMYQSDFLEILWLLKRENVKSEKIEKALDLLKSKMNENNSWKIERKINNLVIPMGVKSYGNDFITERAIEVLDFYNN